LTNIFPACSTCNIDFIRSKDYLEALIQFDSYWTLTLFISFAVFSLHKFQGFSMPPKRTAKAKVWKIYARFNLYILIYIFNKHNKQILYRMSQQERARFELRAIFVLSFGSAGGAKNFTAVIGRVQVDKAARLPAIESPSDWIWFVFTYRSNQSH